MASCRTCRRVKLKVVLCHCLELVGLAEQLELAGNMKEGNGENHQESVMGGGVNALGGNVGGAPPTAFGVAEFMQGMSTTIE